MLRNAIHGAGHQIPALMHVIRGAQTAAVALVAVRNAVLRCQLFAPACWGLHRQAVRRWLNRALSSQLAEARAWFAPRVAYAPVSGPKGLCATVCGPRVCAMRLLQCALLFLAEPLVDQQDVLLVFSTATPLACTRCTGPSDTAAAPGASTCCCAEQSA